MVYTNMVFDLEKIFTNVPITKITPPLTKKKKNVDKKKLSADYGSIINIQKGIRYRGVDIRKVKKHWCICTCRQIIKKGNKSVKVNTIIEKPILVESTDIYELRYYCTQCERYYKISELKKITNFLNQVTIVLSIGKVILNIMLFKDNFKIAGCKENNDAVEAAMILWEDYISKIPGAWKFKDDETEQKFVFQLVMRNVDFKLGFFIDREALNVLMNSEEYSDKVFMSQCETTGHTNVNIKMYAIKPKDFEYDCLVYPEEGEVYITSLKENPYKIKKEKKMYTTFIVFSSSEIILSGRYEKNMEDMYNFFVNEALKHRKDIEEKIVQPGTDLITHLKK